MKRFSLILACFTAFLFAIFSKADIVDKDQAAAVAQRFLGTKVKLVDQKCKSNGLVEETPPALYIFKRDDTERGGFVIVSADNAVKPILAWSDNAPVEEVPDNMAAWIENMERQINALRLDSTKQTKEIAAMWDGADKYQEELILETAEWNQGSPYNNQCPTYGGQHCFTGCVATALAIAMKYYEFPQQSRGVTEKYKNSNSSTTYSRDLNHKINWDKMPLTYHYNWTDEQCEEVSQLMADIGAACKIDYGTSASFGMYDNKALTYHYNYYCEWPVREDYNYDQWHEMLHKELSDRHVVLYQGYPESGDGHAFLLDGYSTDGEDPYYHVNWGWGGMYNGFFTLDNLSPDGNYSDFTQGQSATLFYPLPADGEPVAKVGKIPFYGIREAFEGAKYKGETLMLLKDIENADSSNICYSIYPDESLTIDLNGHRFVTNISNFGELFIIDSKNGGCISNASNSSSFNYILYNDDAGTIFIDGIKIENVANNSYTIYNYGLLTIKNSNIISSSEKPIINNSNTGTIFIDGVKIENVANNSYTISNTGLLTIKNSNIISSSEEPIINNSNCMTIEKSFFSCKSNTKGKVLYLARNSTTTISGSHFYSSLCNDDSDLEAAIYMASQQSECEIENSVIEAPGIYGFMGWDAKLTIKDTYVYAKKIWNSYLKPTVWSGAFSSPVEEIFLASPTITCRPNTDETLKEKYPYIVGDENYLITSTEDISSEQEDEKQKIYTLDGLPAHGDKKGLHIIIDGKNKTKKIF